MIDLLEGRSSYACELTELRRNGRFKVWYVVAQVISVETYEHWSSEFSANGESFVENQDYDEVPALSVITVVGGTRHLVEGTIEYIFSYISGEEFAPRPAT